MAEAGISPDLYLVARLSRVAQSDPVVAIAAIDWSAFSRLEGDFGFLATLSAHCGEHLAPRPVATATATATIAISLRLPCFTAGWATLGLVGVAFSGKEFLLFDTEGEGSPAVRTLKRLLLKAHWMTSSLLLVG
jgi:hypothetical protein